jgi:hypothetical protein
VSEASVNSLGLTENGSRFTEQLHPHPHPQFVPSLQDCSSSIYPFSEKFSSRKYNLARLQQPSAVIS